MPDNEEGAEKVAKIIEKIAKKIWKCQLFAVTLHPLSALKTEMIDRGLRAAK